MKITFLGDTHGRKSWKTIVNKNKENNFIFLGDYVDPYRSEKIGELAAIRNLEAIIEFKKTNDKVTLLIGNHDAQYLFYPSFRTNALSRSKYFDDIIKLFQDNKNLFQYAVQKDKHLFTHAGVSNGWFNDYLKLFKYFELDDDLSNFGVVLNKIGKDPRWRYALSAISFYRGGDDNFGGITWADKRELVDDYLTGFHQIVGHNKHAEIIRIGDDISSITFIDCLWNKVNKNNSLTLDI
jgi:hypothetical protein